MVRYLFWYLISHRHIYAILPFATDRAIIVRYPTKNKHEINLRYYRYKYRTIWKVSLLGLWALRLLNTLNNGVRGLKVWFPWRFSSIAGLLRWFSGFARSRQGKQTFKPLTSAVSEKRGLLEKVFSEKSVEILENVVVQRTLRPWKTKEKSTII